MLLNKQDVLGIIKKLKIAFKIKYGFTLNEEK